MRKLYESILASTNTGKKSIDRNKIEAWIEDNSINRECKIENDNTITITSNYLYINKFMLDDNGKLPEYIHFNPTPNAKIEISLSGIKKLDYTGFPSVCGILVLDSYYAGNNVLIENLNIKLVSEGGRYSNRRSIFSILNEQSNITFKNSSLDIAAYHSDIGDSCFLICKYIHGDLRIYSSNKSSLHMSFTNTMYDWGLDEFNDSFYKFINSGEKGIIWKQYTKENSTYQISFENKNTKNKFEKIINKHFPLFDFNTFGKISFRVVVNKEVYEIRHIGSEWFIIKLIK